MAATADRGMPNSSSPGESASRINATLLTWKPNQSSKRSKQDSEEQGAQEPPEFVEVGFNHVITYDCSMYS